MSEEFDKDNNAFVNENQQSETSGAEHPFNTNDDNKQPAQTNEGFSEPLNQNPPYQQTPFGYGCQDNNSHVESIETKTEEQKKEKKSGNGAKAYLAIMTVAFVVVVAMLGFCIMKLDKLGTKDDDTVIPGKITIADDDEVKATTSDEGNQKEPAVTVQASDDASKDNSELTSLYNESSKGCVSILCEVTVNSGFFGQSYSGQSLGSGFVIDKAGYIVTNHHVIDDAKKIIVQFYDGEQVDAELVGSDETCDLAVLKIKTDRTLYPLVFGNSDKVQIGEKVYAIGTPSNIKLAGTLTYGVISGKEREVSLTNDSGSVVKKMTLLQTDATLNPGNSGGPLFNMKGQVIGINTLKLSSEYEGIGFAIPSSGAVVVINDLIENGEVTNKDDLFAKGSAQLGIEGSTVTEENLPEGVFVVTVNRKSTVYREGLSAGDVITEFNGTAVTSIEQLKELLAECSAGQEVKMKYYRPDRRDETKGEYFEITFKLDAQAS